ncbi:MAG: tetratricopeptide repeat protein, partial [Candidatus Sumerlaeia bacterium]|nr:tetratricopeptide repeat protein [Candidatus Sumerlaeia bacterium]
MMSKSDLKKCTISVVAGLCALFLIFSVSGWGQAPPVKATPENNKKKLGELKEKAAEYYRNADFTLALNYFQEALRLAKDDVEIKTRIEDCQRKIQEKKDLLATVPVDPRKREEFLAQKYTRAKELYNVKKYTEARKEFYELWLIAGKYKKTLSYMEDIDKRRQEMEKKTQEAQVATTAVAKKEAEKKMTQQVTEEEKKKAKIKKLLQQGDQAFTSGKYEKAIESYTEVLALDKENKEAGQKLEQAKIAQEQARQAQKKEQEQKLQINNHLEKGKDLYNAGNYQEALKEFQAVLTLDKTHKKAKKYIEKTNSKIIELQKAEEAQKAKDEKIKEGLARASELTVKENYSEALKEYENVLKLDKNNKEAREAREKVRQLMNAKEAKAREEQKLKKMQEEIQAKLSGFLKKGETALKEGNFTRAIENYQEALKLDANNQTAREGIAKAQSMKQAKEKEEAEKKKAEEERKAQELAKAKKEREEAEQKRKAEEERKAQELARAKKEKEEAEQKRKAEEERKAQELAKAKKEKEEAEQKRKAEEEKKAQELARAKKEIEVAQKPETEKEKKELEQIEKIKREQQKKSEDLTRKGKELFQRGKYEEALKNFEEALQLNPLNAEAGEYKAMTEAKLEEIKRAEEKKKEEERLKKEAQQKAETLYAEALEAFRGRQYALAEQKATEALKVLPGWAKANQLLQDIEDAKKTVEKDKVSQLIAEGKDLYNKGQYNEAIEKFKEALNIMPVNEEASRYISLCNQRIEERQRELDRRQKETKKSEAMRLFQAGLSAYRDKKLDEAVAKWEEALKVYPELEDAKRYLEQTKDEYQQYLSAKLEKETFAQREKSAQEKLNTLITIVTKKPIPLRDFLKNLYIISDIDFYVAEGVEAQIEVKFEDKPLYEVLDTVLLPIGLKWERKPGTDIIF